MDVIEKSIAVYSENHTSPESELLKKIDRDTHLNVLMPNMVSGHLQGRILAAFSQMIRPERILEIGTFTGYSAICLAEGLQETGKLITIDINDELEDLVKNHFEKSGFNEKIDFRIGNAMEIIPTLDEIFDIIFIDADKVNYINYYHLVFNKVKKGGFIIADNVLWKGKVAVDKEKTDKDTQKLLNFNKMIQDDPRVENVLFPIRDGLMVARKLV